MAKVLLVKLPELVNNVDLDTVFETVEDLRRDQIAARLSAVIGIAWTVGSVFFFPQLDAITLGAEIFLGSSIAAMLVSLWWHGLLVHRFRRIKLKAIGTASTGAPLTQRLLEPSDMGQSAASLLYRRLLSRATLVCTAAYIVGNALFVAGSVFFIPISGDSQQRMYTYHGCWIFLLGTAIFLLAGILALELSLETRATTNPLRHLKRHEWWLMPSWTDQDLSVCACRLYVIACILYTIALAWFYPREWSSGEDTLSTTMFTAASVLFVVGSFLFALGGALDERVVERKLRRLCI